MSAPFLSATVCMGLWVWRVWGGVCEGESKALKNMVPLFLLSNRNLLGNRLHKFKGRFKNIYNDNSNPFLLQRQLVHRGVAIAAHSNRKQWLSINSR